MSGVLHSALAATGNNPISVVNTFLGSSISSGVTTVSMTGLQVGDLLLAAGGGAGTNDLTATGWTMVASVKGVVASNNRVLTIFTRTATETSHTATITGASLTNAQPFSCGIAFRSATSIGASNTIYSTATGTAVTLPTSLSMQRTDGTSALACFSYVSTIDGNNFSFTTSNSVTYKLGQSSWATERTLNSYNTIGFLSGVVEVLD